jgi:hypothetical protein
MCDVVVLTMGTGGPSLMDSVLALAAKRGRVVVTNIYPMSDSRPNLALSGLAQWEFLRLSISFGRFSDRYIRNVARKLIGRRVSSGFGAG